METQLNALAKNLHTAKRAEAKAKADRIAIEEQISNLVPVEGGRGSKTVDAGEGMKITVKYGFSYKAEVEAIRNLDIPEEVMPVKFKPSAWEFDKTAYEKVRQSHPDIAKKLAEFVVATPAKVGVTIKLS